jgi:single-stranded DNA-binding protein
MNSCSITGYLTENPRVSIVDDVVLAEFVMVTYSYRRTKSGEKSRIPTYIHCEAWHTGAETLEKYATKGTKLVINASAKNSNPDSDDIIFRINEFDFCHKDYKDS